MLTFEQKNRLAKALTAAAKLFSDLTPQRIETLVAQIQVEPHDGLMAQKIAETAEITPFKPKSWEWFGYLLRLTTQIPEQQMSEQQEQVDSVA